MIVVYSVLWACLFTLACVSLVFGSVKASVLAYFACAIVSVILNKKLEQQSNIRQTNERFGTR